MTRPLPAAEAVVDILIVEDSPTQAEQLRFLLEQWPYRVALATNGKRALAYLQDDRPALVISDIDMPEMTGFELCQRIKAAPALQAIPVILLTSLSDTEDVLRGLACGADSFITKPYSATYLLELVQRTLAEASVLSQIRPGIEVEISLAGKSQLITTNPQRTVSLLLSTYEAALHRNLELVHTQAELNALNEHLEDLVLERTRALSSEIEERKLAEAQLRQSEEFFRLLAEGLRDAALFMLDPDGRVASWNGGAEAIQGYRAEEIIGQHFSRFYVDTDIENGKPARELEIATEKGQLHDEGLRRHKDGSTFMAEVTITALYSDAGKLRSFVKLTRDITERKQAEAALGRSEKAYRTLFENSPIGLYRTALDGQILEANPTMTKIFGYPDRAALQSVNIVDLYVDPTSDQKFRHAIEEHGTVNNFVSEFSRLDGTTFWAEDNVRAVRDEAGNPILFEGSLIDITERKQADEKVRFQAHLLDTVGQAVIATNLAGEVIYWNRFAETLYGWTAAEALQRNILEVMISEPALEQAAEILARLKSGESWNGEFPVKRRDGSRFPALVVDSPILTEDGTLIGIVGVSTDISEIKQREQELEALAGASLRLRPTEARAEMPAVILDLLMTLFKAEGAALVIHDAPAREWLVELGRGNLAEATGTRQPESVGLSGQIITSGQLYVSSNLNADPDFKALVSMPDPLASAGAPLIAQSKTIGVLWIGRRTPITQSEARLLVAFADIAANAIQRATLQKQTERHLSQLQTLHAIDQAIKSSLDLRLTFTLLLEYITTELGVDAACILIVNPHTKVLEFMKGRGFNKNPVERVQVRLGEGYAGQAALDRRIVHIPNLEAMTDNVRLMKTLAGEGFVSYYAVPLIAKGQVQGVLELFHRRPLKPDDDWLEFLDSLADQTAIAIDSARLFEDLQRSNQELLMAYSATIEGWSRALDLRDKETEGHSQRVTGIALDLAQAMGGFSQAELTYFRWGCLLHDIGKMGVPDHILLKPGKLTDDEWTIMRQHPALAYQLLFPVDYLRPALDIPHSHHEKWDGSGYPQGLAGESIPRAARLFAVVDVWDALRSDRPYRPGWPEAQVRQYIADLAGIQFDPQVVTAFLGMLAQENSSGNLG